MTAGVTDWLLVVGDLSSAMTSKVAFCGVGFDSTEIKTIASCRGHDTTSPE